MENRINKILVLDDNEKFVVINQAVYKEVSYLLINRVDDAEENLLEETFIVKEVIEEGKATLEEVEDSKLFELLTKYLAPKE